MLSSPTGSGGSVEPTFETRQLGGNEIDYSGPPISISFKDADLQELFRLFADYSGMNIIVDSSVKGETITLDVTDVPWDQVMALVLKTNSLGYSLDGNVLRIAPLSKLAKEEQDKKMEAYIGEKKDIAWGSQIRSYTLQPYQLIKDHRTGIEVGDVSSVLDGEIDKFVNGYLMNNR